MLESKFYFAGKTVSIKTNNKKISNYLNLFQKEFASNKKPDLKLEYFFYKGNLDLNEQILKNRRNFYEKILFNEKKNLIKFKGKKSEKGKEHLFGWLDLNKNKGKIEIHANTPFFWNFFIDNLSKCIAVYFNDFECGLIHSSAVRKKNKGYLFCGAPTAGKTTTARMCEQGLILGEDLNFLFKKRKKFFIQSCPFNSVPFILEKKSSEPVELKAVFFIIQAKKLKLEKLSKFEGTAKLIMNDYYGPLNFTKIKAKERLGLYSDLMQKVPAFLLRLPIQQKVMEKIEEKLEKELN